MTGRGTLDYARPSGRPAPRWLRRLALWMAGYPLLMLASLYATWLSAWVALGHRPRASLDDPKYIGPGVDVFYLAFILLMFGAIPALAVHVVALLAMLAVDRSPDRLVPPSTRLRLALAALAWVVALIVLASDPGRVLNWYLD